MKIIKYTVACILIICLFAAGCVHIPFFRRRESQVGIASYYGREFHGKRTASGEIYNMRRCTAAHRTLPFGSIVRVTNLSNGPSVKVKTNDHGPFVKGWIIDLSHGATRKLRMIESGVTKVRIDVLSR